MVFARNAIALFAVLALLTTQSCSAEESSGQQSSTGGTGAGGDAGSGGGVEQGGAGGLAGAAGSAGAGGVAEAGPWTLTSTAFVEGAGLPDAYTCSGTDLSPPLAWSQPPVGTVSLALQCDDPDAPSGTFSHWLIWSIDPLATGLPEGIPTTATVLDHAQQGTNGFGALGYRGPCPPPGKVHHYHFKLYALDAELQGLTESSVRSDFETALGGHVLGSIELIGTYIR